MIHVNFNNVKEEIDKFGGQDLGDHGNGNGSNSTRRPKFISFFVNNRSSHFEQLITTMKMIQVNVDDINVDDIVSTLFRWRMEYNLKEKVREVEKK